MNISMPVVSVDLVRAALRSESLPSDYTPDSLRAAADRYERFLCLAAQHPGRELAPTRDIDLMWHLHMLAPRAYSEDCHRLFGDILDHDGGFGAAADERDQLDSCFAETAELWAAAYGEPYLGQHKRARCKHHCQVTRCKRKNPV